MNVTSVEQAYQILGETLPLQKIAAHGANEGLYSFDTREATRHSYITAIVKQASPDVMAQCATYAKFWDIRDQTAGYEAKLAAYVPPSLPDDAYALRQGDIRKYASHDQDSTRNSAIAFVDHRHLYPLEWRKTAAARLIARAEKHGSHLPQYVETELHKTACLGWIDAAKAEDALVQRMNKVAGHSDVTEKLAALVNELDDTDAVYDPEFVKAAVAAFEDFDAATGMTDHYGAGVGLPEEIIGQSTNVLEKCAGVSNTFTKLSNGAEIDLFNLKKTALEAIDPELVKLSNDELADVLPTLPKGDADLLAHLARG